MCLASGASFDALNIRSIVVVVVMRVFVFPGSSDSDGDVWNVASVGSQAQHIRFVAASNVAGPLQVALHRRLQSLCPLRVHRVLEHPAVNVSCTISVCS